MGKCHPNTVYACFDGSFKEMQNVTAIGFVIFDSKGKILHEHSEACKYNGATSQRAESKAFYKLMSFLVEKGYKNVVVCGDNLGVIRDAKQGSCRKYDPIYDTVKKFNYISFRYINRKLNSHAHNLCQKAYANRYKNKDVYMYT